MKHRSLYLVLVLGLCVGGKLLLEKKRLVKEPTVPNLKPLMAAYHGESLDRHSLGFNSFLGALIWVQILQKMDYHPVTSDEVSWEYAQADALTTLDPNNVRAYDFGSIFLSVLRRDKLGGKLFLEKWVKKDPNFWRPTYLLGSHHFLELHDYARAAPYILRASTMRDAPQWMSSLGIRLLSETGALFNALKLSIDLATELSDGEALERMLLRVRSLNYKLQKKNWEEALEKYRKDKGREPTRLTELSSYSSEAMRELSSLSSNEKQRKTQKLEGSIREVFSFLYDAKLKQIVPQQPELVAELEMVGIHPEPKPEGEK